MEFTDKELRLLLQALYRFRSDVSGFSQTEQNKLAVVEQVVSRIEKQVGPLKGELTAFDREMQANLSSASGKKAKPAVVETAMPAEKSQTGTVPVPKPAVSKAAPAVKKPVVKAKQPVKKKVEPKKK